MQSIKKNRYKGNKFREKAKPKDLKNTVLRLWKYFKSDKKIIFLVIMLVIIETIVTAVAPYLIGRVIDLLEIKNINLFKIILCILAVFYLIDAVVKFLNNYIVHGIGQKVVTQMRESLFEKLQKLPIKFFDNNSDGDIMSRLANDIENISSGVSDSIIAISSGVLSIIITLIIMITLSPILTLCTIVTIPLVGILTNSIAKKTKVLFKKQQVELGKLNGHIEEMVGSINIVKAFNYEEKSINRFKSINKDMVKVSIKANIYSSLLMPMMNVINNISFALISVVGALLVTEDIITIGVIATFLSYSKNFTRPLNSLANMFNYFQNTIAGCERVFEILDEDNETEDSYNLKEFEGIKSELSFDNVSFGYKESEYVLKDINLKIKANTSNAIIGETGCGKTTLVNLITRFYDVNKGSIKIDGVNIKDYSIISYKDALGVVLQDSYLFNESIAENIRYGNLNASDEDIVNTCKKVGAHNFIVKLKNGYNTVINESGQELSQGQKQLLAIARTILKNPQILILDEATSSVDTKTELKIQETMLDIMKDKTSFIIAHRLSTIRNCDNIIVIKDGNISEMGSHEELIKLKGYYYENINIIDKERYI